MGGICGWVGPPEAPAVRGERLRRMTAPLTRYLGCACDAWNACDVDDGALARVAPRRAAGVHRDDRLLCVAHGDFYWKDRELAADAAAHGAARTMGLRYLERGPAVLDAIGGAFSVAIVDRAERRAFLAIDRLGVEPLHYGVHAGRLLFASRLTSLLAALDRAPAVDPQAMLDYLYFAFVPSPATGWHGLHALRPAEHLTFEHGEVRSATYWRPAFVERGTGATAGDLRAAMRASVDRVADAHGGVFLSGGVDSSTMVGLMAARGDAPVPAYSLGYHVESSSELPYARITARHFGARHRECFLTPELLVDAMRDVAAAFASPFGNPAAAALVPVARAAAADGVGTMVSGDGGDELFAGNPQYALHRVLGLWDHVPAPLRRALEPLIAHLPLADRVRLVRRVKGYVRRASIPMPDRLRNFNELHEVGIDVLVAPELLATADREGPMRTLRRIWGAVPSTSRLQRMLATDWVILLHGSDLPRMHVVCEMAGMDVVFPMLADDVVDVATRIRPRALMRGTRLRTFYLHAFRDLLPPATLTKPKQGENVPLEHWLAEPGRLRDTACDALASLRGRGIVRTELVDALLRRGALGEPTCPSTMVYRLTMLEHWFRMHVDA